MNSYNVYVVPFDGPNIDYGDFFLNYVQYAFDLLKLEIITSGECNF